MSIVLKSVPPNAAGAMVRNGTLFSVTLETDAVGAGADQKPATVERRGMLDQLAYLMGLARGQGGGSGGLRGEDAPATIKLLFGDIEIKVARTVDGEIVVSTPEGVADLDALDSYAFTLNQRIDTDQPIFAEIAEVAVEHCHGFASYQDFRDAMVAASSMQPLKGQNDDTEIFMLQRLVQFHEQRLLKTFEHVVGYPPEPGMPKQMLVLKVEDALSRLTVLKSVQGRSGGNGAEVGRMNASPLLSGHITETFEILTNRMSMLIDLGLGKPDLSEIDRLLALSQERDHLSGQVAAPGISKLLSIARTVADLGDLAGDNPDLADLRASLLSAIRDEQQRVEALAALSRQLEADVSGSARLGKIAALERVLAGQAPFDAALFSSKEAPAPYSNISAYLLSLRDRLPDLEVARCRLLTETLYEVENIEHILPSSFAKIIKFVGSAKAFGDAVAKFEQAQQRLEEAQDWQARLRRFDRFMAELTSLYATADLALHLQLSGDLDTGVDRPVGMEGVI